jgi:excinuclease ABC subunit A
VDRVVLKTGVAAQATSKRLEASIAKALQMANGLVLIGLSGAAETEERLFSSAMACPDCGINVARWSRAVSASTPLRRLPECHGLGSIYDFDPARIIVDWSKPLFDGGLGPGSGSNYLHRVTSLAADKYKIDLDKPFEKLPASEQDLLLYGPPRSEAPRTGFHGVIGFLRGILDDAKSEMSREYLMNYMSASACPVHLQGKPLRPESLAVTVRACPLPTSPLCRSTAPCSAAQEI